jgi:hypothetical protein
MRTIEEIIGDIEGLELDGDYWPMLYSLADEMENHPEGASIIPAVLRLFERFPDGEFGEPGPLVHAIEKYYRCGYENYLRESLQGNPTKRTLWLARRIVNAHDENEAIFAPYAEKYR